MSFSFGSPARLLKNELASSTSLRWYSNRLPCSRDEPRGVTSLTCAAPVPSLAPAFCVVMVNSPTPDTLGPACANRPLFELPRRYVSCTLMPSHVMLL